MLLPQPTPPLWIPAFTGMTKWGRENDTLEGAGRTIAGDKPPRYISGFRLGPGKGMQMVGRRTVHSRRAARRVMGWGRAPALRDSLDSRLVLG